MTVTILIIIAAWTLPGDTGMNCEIRASFQAS